MQFWAEEEDGAQRAYPLREGSTIIGRHPSCDIVVAGSNVSKQHIECFVDGGALTIRDLGSSNGTFVNGNQVTSCVLKDGDKVLLGGFQLVLDAPAAAGAAAAAPQQPAPEPPPTAPLETPGGAPRFADEPGADDTPVDGTFVPQAYDSEALQPQVVAREGRMYLRDPRTSREVEIVPRGAAPATDLSGYYADQADSERKRNRYLVIGAIAVALLLIIALAMTSSKPRDDDDDNQRPMFPRQRYNDLTDTAIEDMKKGEFKAAIGKLTEAHKGRPTYAVAGILRDIAREWEKSGKSFDEFNWLSVESALRDLRESNWVTSRVKQFAEDRIDWIYDVQHHEAVVAGALKLLGEDKPEEALAEFQKLPKTSPIYPKYEVRIADTVAAACERRLRLAKAALDGGKWQEAITQYTAARKFASDAHKPRIERGIRSARKRMSEEAQLRAAHARYREDTIPSLMAARKILDGIADGGPLSPRKAALQQRITARLRELERERWHRNAKALYEAGRGTEAIKLIADHRLTELDPLASKIERIMHMLDEAQKAHDAKDYDRARFLWNDAVREETSTKNAYHKRALDKLNGLANKERRKEIALEYRDMGDAALRKDNDPKEARRLYLRAMSWDPIATVGKTRLADMRHQAKVFYNRARDLRYASGDDIKLKEQAIALFRKVQLYVEEGGDLHADATRHIGELEAEIDALRKKSGPPPP